MSMEIEAVASLDVAGRPASVLNMSTIETSAMAANPQFREIALQLGRWVDNARGNSSASNMFRRDRYVPPDNPYDQMRAAKDAVENDDIVAGIAEMTEALAFGGVKWESENSDEADVFNQLSADMNLDAVVRAMWREEFACDQAIVAKLWGPATYTVRGRTANGNRKKKKYSIWAPKRLVVLDNLKCVPIGFGPLRQDDLAWQASKGQIGDYIATYEGTTTDPLMTAFFEGTYSPSSDEMNFLANIGVDPTRLLKMNPDWVFRHTGTRPDYEHFSKIRMRSVFTLLDMKQQLLASDRASLIGAANYILLIRAGNDQKPALPEEVAHLRANYNFLAKLPVIISDHRLQIDIIAPKLDFVLKPDAYNLIDGKITARLFGNLELSTHSRGSSGANLTGGLVGKFMDNRRHMLARTLEREIAKSIINHPKNAGLFETAPSLVYTPRTVAIDTDQAYSAALLALRTQREISRETILEYMGLDQSTEAQRMELEEEIYDEIFKTAIPFAAAPAGPNAPAEDPAGEAPTGGATNGTPNSTPESPSVSGRRGGRPKGGGTSPQSPQAQSKPKTTGGGNPATGA